MTAIALSIVMLLSVGGDLSKWRYQQIINLNTTATGANVKGDVANYPTAIVMDANDFNFAQAKSDGSDLRFTQNGTLLPYSIEVWENNKALIWVKIPLVKGNSKSQSIIMHWGNPDAQDTSDTKTVFNNKEGFVGVWHFNEEGNSLDNGYKDSTGNAADGTGVNIKSEARVDGRLGKSLELDYPELQWVKIDSNKRKLFDLTTRVTFSIWAKARSYSNKGDEVKRVLPGYETMFAKGDNSWRLQKFGIKDWHKPPAELIEICVEKTPRADLCVVGKSGMELDKWYHFVGVHDFPKARVYVNGVLDAEDTFDFNWKSDDHPVGIGNQSQIPDRGRQWDGWLDEARVFEVVKDENWIKLDYESQKEGQKFLTFGKVKTVEK